jgi:hypothetical protein
MYLLNNPAPERVPLTKSQFQPAKDACRLSSANAADLFPDARNSKAALAGALLRLGCWTQSHEIAQDIDSPEGSYWHAIIHRLEPDPFNAQYWFRRVGRHAIFPDLHERAAEIIRQHGQPWRLKTSWDPALFIDWCEEANRQSGKAEEAAIDIQMAEWQLLFDWCAAPPV